MQLHSQLCSPVRVVHVVTTYQVRTFLPGPQGANIPLPSLYRVFSKRLMTKRRKQSALVLSLRVFKPAQKLGKRIHLPSETPAL